MIDRPADRLVKTDPDPTQAVKESQALAIENLRREVTLRFDLSDRAVTLAREEVKTSTAELAKAYADALAAALKATTDANSKLEQSFEKSNIATNEKIDSLTERINIWTGRDSSVLDTKHDNSTDKGQFIVMVSVVIAFAALLLAGAMAFRGVH